MKPNENKETIEETIVDSSQEQENVEKTQVGKSTSAGLFSSRKGRIWLVVALIGFVLLLWLMWSQMTKSELYLVDLIDVPYEITYEKNGELNQYEVDVVMEGTDDDVLQLSEELAQTIYTYEKNTNSTITLNVYPETSDTVGEFSDPFDSSNQTHYVVIDEWVTVTTVIEMGDIEGNVVVTEDWEIFNSHYDDNKNLIGSVSLIAVPDEETTFIQLKGIASEMMRFNEVSTSAYALFDYQPSETVQYHYASSRPTSLFKTIQKLIQVEKKS